MLCTSCGAPMALFRERSYFFCEYCGSFHFPTASADGVRLLGEAPDRRTCPICRERLLVATIDDAYQGYKCGNCRGLLLDRFTFREVVQRRRTAATTEPDAPRPRSTAELKRSLRCPTCRQSMETHPYYGPGNIIIDTCHTCNNIWLDPKEMARVVNAPGSDRGPESRRRAAARRRPLPTKIEDERPGAVLWEFMGNLFE